MSDDHGGEVEAQRLGLFTAALGLGEPWRVSGAEFDEDAGWLDLQVDHPRGARFACPEPECGQDRCPVHDTHDKTWRHLDFFQRKAFLHARVPRVRCPEHGVRLVALPWARPGSGFTMLFEALVLTFAQAMPMSRVAAMTGEHDTALAALIAYLFAEHHGAYGQVRGSPRTWPTWAGGCRRTPSRH